MTRSIDHGILSELTDSIGTSSLARIIKIFLNELDTQIIDICSHLAADQIDQVENLAHSLKSTTATFGATDLNAIAEKLEHAARNENRDALAPLVESLRKGAQETKPLFTPYTE